MVKYDYGKFPSFREFQVGLARELGLGKINLSQAQSIAKYAVEMEIYVEENIVTEATGFGTTIERNNYKVYDSATDAFKLVSAGVTQGFPKLFNQKLRQLKNQSLDIVPVLKILRDDFFDTNEKAIFSQTGAGGNPGFQDLDVKTQLQKRNIYGTAYPILVGKSGDLMRSLTEQNDIDAIQEVKGRQLVLGSKVPYAKRHQQDFETFSQPPQRKPVQIDPKGSGRLDRWIKKIDTYLVTGKVKK